MIVLSLQPTMMNSGQWWDQLMHVYLSKKCNKKSNLGCVCHVFVLKRFQTKFHKKIEKEKKKNIKQREKYLEFQFEL